ncbi:MAG TPA: VOC family protein [Actinomycetota bacterium]|nr:VOC family protein [Actinomycetota bacterium]
MRRLGLVLDCRDPERLAEFWAGALGYRRLGGAGQYVLLRPSEPGEPNLLLQGVPEAKVVKNRMHLDIETPDIEAEAARLQTLGATRVESGTRREHGSMWVLMADPEGNEFCVCDGGSGS